MKGVSSFEGLPQIGGHPALDLLNTVEYRGRADPGDRLTTARRLIAWSGLAGLIDSRERGHLEDLDGLRPAEGRRVLQEVRDLRESGRSAFAARLGLPADRPSLARLRSRIESAARRVQVVVDPAETSFRREHRIIGLDSLVDRIALTIEDAFSRADAELLRECEGEDCDWLFFDRSRGRQRRWCRSTLCGNAVRVRNFRARGERRT